MLFKKETPLYAYEVIREGGVDVMYINYLGAPYIPSIADSPDVMARTIEALIENPNVSKIVFVQQRNYVYDSSMVFLLVEIAQIYNHLIKQEKILTPSRLVLDCTQCLGNKYNDMAYFSLLLKRDPVLAYHEVKRFWREERINLEKTPPEFQVYELNYLRLLEKIISLLENTRIVRETKKEFTTKRYAHGSREIYKLFFRPDVVPNFTFTRLVATLPEDAEIIEQYEIASGPDRSVVTILRKKGEPKYIYHLLPPEYTLEEDYQMLLNLARNVLIERQPKAEEFMDFERTRRVFSNIARDLLQDLANTKGISLTYSQLEVLSNILIRYTIGFGIIEVLLQDENIQDISLNAPIPLNPIFIRHGKYDECTSNIIPSQEDAESWAAKFRMLSGRPLDEANPILDTELGVKNARARVAIIQQPLSPRGLAYSFRRHRDKPWTLPLLVDTGMLNSFGAGLLSFFIDGARTMLVAGTRSAGKTSLLGSLMLEIMPKFRIITVEDTLELPVDAIRELGYDIQRMKVRSALLKTSAEVAADEGIRTSLRLGDSCLIIGEVRSEEALALYESMRIGALANVVAGTIHGGSPYSVFDRVVNDLKVPITSFKATDLIVVANPVKSPSGGRAFRRVISVSEVRKEWKNDPLEEGGFVDLLKYNVEKDQLEPTADLINGDSVVIKDIAANVKGWAGNWDAVYDNILLRGKMKEELVKIAREIGRKDLLEAKFHYLSNSIFYEVSEKVKQEIGLPLSERVFPEWQKLVKEEAKKFIKGEI
ncbi:MAG: type II/IV secretion system ATPase subunit [Candidatus Pacearchaeota archaeon]